MRWGTRLSILSRQARVPWLSNCDMCSTRTDKHPDLHKGSEVDLLLAQMQLRDRGEFREVSSLRPTRNRPPKGGVVKPRMRGLIRAGYARASVPSRRPQWRRVGTSVHIMPRQTTPKLPPRLRDQRRTVRAITRFSTRVAPARLSTRASSFRVAPVVMTSSSTATLAPERSTLHRNAPRTFFARSS